MRNKSEQSRERLGKKREGLNVEFVIFPFVSFLFFTQVTSSPGVMVHIHVHYQVNLNL